MSRKNDSLSDEVRSCIRDHLAAIDGSLSKAGAPLDDRLANTEAASSEREPQ
jgi:hypothetical protein